MSFTRTILITGSTDGIGKQTAINLARSAENFVIVHGRSVARAEQAVADIKKVVGPTANLDYAVGDFGSMKSVAAMAVDVRERFPKLNVLFLNAGVLLPQRTESSDNIEMTFQVNHLAHFLLTQRLIDTLKANAPSRVIVVSSSCEAWHPIAWDDLERRSDYEKYIQYSRTFSSLSPSPVVSTAPPLQQTRSNPASLRQSFFMLADIVAPRSRTGRLRRHSLRLIHLLRG